MEAQPGPDGMIEVYNIAKQADTNIVHPGSVSDTANLDAADPCWLNRVTWYCLFEGTREYPGQPGEQPGMIEHDDDRSGH
jgi:hypothetical protein